MPFIPPPYEQPAPDGRTYFKILGVPPHVIRMYDLLLTASELAQARNEVAGRSRSSRARIERGVGASSAARIDELLLSTKREVDNNALRTAAEADRRIREKIQATRVRPPTLGQKNDNTSLISGIRSRPVPSVLPGGGAVGIADVDELVQATLRPSIGSKTPFYWRAQEFGSDHLVGHVVYGVFQPGEAAPSGSQSRRHPLFESRGGGIELAGGGGTLLTGGKSYKMVVRNPIGERGFLREGAWEAYLFRKRLNAATESRAVTTMQRIR